MIVIVIVVVVVVVVVLMFTHSGILLTLYAGSQAELTALAKADSHSKSSGGV